MLTVQGKIKQGQLILEEPLDTKKDYEVLVTFVKESYNNNTPKNTGYGSLKGLLRTPDDFNDPIDDLKEYM